MPGITMAVTEELKSEIKHLSWVNWSEIAREEARKKEIFDRYLKAGKLSDEDWKFCEGIDWIPGDWLPLRKEFIKELEEASRRPLGKTMTVDELDKLIGLK